MDLPGSEPAAHNAALKPLSESSTKRRRVIILGAAGRDFHNFNVVYRDNQAAQVCAFTAAQIPGIAGRRYPASLAGPLYPAGIPIADEAELEALCRAHSIEEVVFAYSDVLHEHVMHVASRALAAGADFILLGPRRTMLTSSLPVIAVTAVRTGCGKSPIARWLAQRLRRRGMRVAVLRHPMPYGNLALERVQRFGSVDDLDAAECSAEEREEYEPHIAMGSVVFSGIDYAAILQAAEKEADIVVWDGGNNDFPFVAPNFLITIADALRPLQIATHHPGEAVARMADVLVINKVDAASQDGVRLAAQGLRAVNAAAPIVQAASPVRLDDMAAVKGQRVLVVEDGPTITHGGMAYGAGYVAAVAAGALAIVDPRHVAAPGLRRMFEAFPHIGQVLPAIGYTAVQLRELETTINDADADVVVSGTPVDLGRMLRINKKIVRAHYEFCERGEPKLSALVDAFIDRMQSTGAR
jgi:predicted GTPase